MKRTHETVDNDVDKIIQMAKDNPELVSNEIETFMLDYIYRTFCHIVFSASEVNRDPQDVWEAFANVVAGCVTDLVRRTCATDEAASKMYQNFLNKVAGNMNQDLMEYAPERRKLNGVQNPA